MKPNQACLLWLDCLLLFQVGCDSRPLSFTSPSNLSASTAVYLFGSKHLIFYITASTLGVAITPLTPRRLFDAAACRLFFGFLNGPQNVDCSNNPASSARLGRRGFVISRTINSFTPYWELPYYSGHVSAWQCHATGLASGLFMPQGPEGVIFTATVDSNSLCWFCWLGTIAFVFPA